MDVDKYLRICEQLKQEPDPHKMPLTLSDFPYEVQVAFFIFDFLPDNWEGMSGSYLGKLWTNLEYLFDLHQVEERGTILYLMKVYEGTLIKYRAEEADRKRKAEERRSKASGGGNYAHSVKG